MYTYHAIIMSLNETQNKTRFSREVLDDILAKQPVVPVRINFVGDSFGHTITFWEHPMNDLIECEFEINQPNMDELNLFCVPGGVVHINDIKQDENGVTVIHRMELTELSITSFPSDMKLTRMEKPKE